jgi:hypothetical protein
MTKRTDDLDLGAPLGSGEPSHGLATRVRVERVSVPFADVLALVWKALAALLVTALLVGALGALVFLAISALGALVVAGAAA